MIVNIAKVMHNDLLKIVEADTKSVCDKRIVAAFNAILEQAKAQRPSDAVLKAIEPIDGAAPVMTLFVLVGQVIACLETDRPPVVPKNVLIG